MKPKYNYSNVYCYFKTKTTNVMKSRDTCNELLCHLFFYYKKKVIILCYKSYMVYDDFKTNLEYTL